jgi:hypothetical protein
MWTEFNDVKNFEGLFILLGRPSKVYSFARNGLKNRDQF